MNPLTPTETPVTKLMTFSEAIVELTNGKRIARVAWNNTDYGLLKDSFVQIFIDGTFHIWKINDGDLMSDDWIVLPDLN